MLSHYQIICCQVWMKSNENCRGSALKFAAPYGPVLRKMSKSNKIFDNWQIAKKSIRLYSPMVISVLVKCC